MRHSTSTAGMQAQSWCWASTTFHRGKNLLELYMLMPETHKVGSAVFVPTECTAGSLLHSRSWLSAQVLWL